MRAVRDETPVAPAAPIPPASEPATELIAAVNAEVRRLAERLERVDGKVARVADRVERVEAQVELIRDGDETPLAWPVPVNTDSQLEVPPLEVSRRPSPAFDVLLGAPSHPKATARRDSA